MMFSFSVSSPMSYEKEMDVKKSYGSWYLEDFWVCFGIALLLSLELTIYDMF